MNPKSKLKYIEDSDEPKVTPFRKGKRIYHYYFERDNERLDLIQYSNVNLRRNLDASKIKNSWGLSCFTYDLVSF